VRTKILFIIVAIAFLIPIGASANPKNINLKPIQVDNFKFAKFGVAKIDSSVSGETIIGRYRRETTNTYWAPDGTYFSSYGNKKTRDINGSQVFNPQIMRDYTQVILEELKNAGYSCSEGAVPSLFEEAETKDDSRFQIGAVILKCNARTIPDALENDVTEFHLAEIEWQVFDRSTKKVIHKESTSGWDKKRGNAIHHAAVAGFRKAFRNFLASEKFVEAVKSASGEQ